MELDMDIILTLVPLMIAGILLIIFIPSIVTGDKATALRLLSGALFLLSFAALGSSLISGQLDLEYILKFLCLKKVGIRSYRLAAALAYLLIVWGLTSLFVITSKKVKNSKGV